MASLKVLVTGATGKQGGALARQLLKKGHAVRVLTRKPDSAPAQTLRQLGAEVVQGDFGNRSSLEKAARGVDAIFAMSTPFEAGMEAETRQGIALADAAKAVGVNHLVFTSVAGADRSTGVPHFDSKYEVEKHIKSLGLPYTIIAPVFFMENALAPWMLPGLQAGKLQLALPATRKLQQIALADIGGFAVVVVEQRERFLGKRIDIAGDELTGAKWAEILSRATGRRIEYWEQPLEQVRAWSADMAKMFEWFNRVGYSCDLAGLGRDYPQIGWHDYERWVREQDWSALLQPAVQ